MIYHVHIDLEKSEVTRISPPFGASGVMITNGTVTTYGDMKNGNFSIEYSGSIGNNYLPHFYFFQGMSKIVKLR